MCYEEFIAYQCGHRSMGVVRTCPMTTAGHNFPICGLPPHKPHYAETMCTPCERQLHSRWVLIREWEHRWLHERGACGCEVIFPGLLTTPRVIGHTSVAESPASTTGSEDHMAAADGTDATPNLVATIEGSKEAQQQTEQGGSQDAGSAGAAGQIPALFEEGVTATGEHRVAVRLPGLYAAEWKADHAALHKAGKCTCAATFTPYKPEVSDDEVTAQDRDNLSQWRQREIEGEKSGDVRGIKGQIEETIKRIAEIKTAFGEFEVEEDKQPPKIKLPRLPAPAAAENPTAKVRGQGQGNNNNNNNNNSNPRHFNRRLENRRERNLPSRPQSQPTRRPSASPPTHGQLIVSSPSINQPPAQATTTTTTLAMPMPAPLPMAGGGGYPQPEHPHPQHQHHLHHQHVQHPQHHQQQYLTPAHPAYATPTTYNDAIPTGAFPWAAAPQATPGMPWITQGPGPYRTPGLVHVQGRSEAGVGLAGTVGGGGAGQGIYHPLSYQGHNLYGQGHNLYGQGHNLYGQGQGQGYGYGHGRGYHNHNHRSRQHGGGRQVAALEGPRQVQVHAQELEVEVEEERGRGRWPHQQQHQQQHHQLDHQQHHQQQEQHGHNPGHPETLPPLCGLPIGAGPEGTSHMPHWLDCPLRRSASVGVAGLVTGGGHGGGGDGRIGVASGKDKEEVEVKGEGGREEVVGRETMGKERQRRDAEQNESKDSDDDESDRLLTPPPPPTRRHSAAT